VTRMIRRTLGAILGGSLPLWFAAPALADEPCPPPDLTCVVDDVVERSGEVVEVVPDPIGGTTEPVVRPILGRVHQVLGGGGPTDPPGGHGTAGGDRGGRPEQPGSGAVRRPPHGTGQTRQGAEPARTAHDRAPHHLSTPPTSSVVRPPSDPQPPVERRDRVGPAAAAVTVARSLVVVGVLFGISLGFLLIQQRLDRDDPKLAEAPLEPEIVTFA
jgi:hypothetical protein